MKFKAASIGTFDGVHRGHNSVIEILLSDAAKMDLEPVIITFDRHPLALIDPSRIPPAITSLERKQELLAKTGVTPLVFAFDEKMRSTSAEEWMIIMHAEMGIRHLVIGYDNTFGYDGINLSLSDYKKIGEKIGITVTLAPQIKEISSSAIRKAIVKGDIESASEMLGRPVFIKGKVVKGNGIGRTLGFPTANISIVPGLAIPGKGVYAATAELPDGTKYPAMVNIGTRPTLRRGDNLVIEAHIIGWKGDLYDKVIKLYFHSRLRDEKKFESIEELKIQIEKDLKQILESGISVTP